MVAGSGYSRKKEPEAVRRALLDAAARLALQHGLAGVSIQAVADAAGVTKGGLFHHFPSKDALLDGMVADLLQRLDDEIDALMANDPQPHGVFTRAYVNSALAGNEFAFGSDMAALSMAMTTEPRLRPFWATWLQQRLARHRDTDGSPILEIVRFATDGAWFYGAAGAEGASEQLAPLRERLLAMTYEE
ncbi:MAG: TetR/AcrR family transcriptional regulator [Pseudomonadota bacterium]